MEIVGGIEAGATKQLGKVSRNGDKAWEEGEPRTDKGSQSKEGRNMGDKMKV